MDPQTSKADINRVKQSYSLSFDDNQKMIHLSFLEPTPNREDNDLQVELIEEEVLLYFYKHPSSVYCATVDLTQTEDIMDDISDKARTMWINLIEHEQVSRVAVIGNNIFYKIIVNLVASSSGKLRNCKWFTKRENAIKWLKS